MLPPSLSPLGRPAREEHLALGKAGDDEIRVLECGHRNGRDLPPISNGCRRLPAPITEPTIRLVSLILKAKHATRERIEVRDVRGTNELPYLGEHPARFETRGADVKKAAPYADA
jgi:hypothetical protein